MAFALAQLKKKIIFSNLVKVLAGRVAAGLQKVAARVKAPAESNVSEVSMTDVEPNEPARALL